MKLMKSDFVDLTLVDAYQIKRRSLFNGDSFFGGAWWWSLITDLSWN